MRGLNREGMHHSFGHRMEELLHEIEKRRLRRAYREYYKIRRNNFFASLAHFPGLWESFMLLDETFVREFDDMYHMRDEDAVTPLMLFMNGHKQIRTAMELGFAGDSLEAWNTMRMAIDCTYQACKILADPTLGHIWAKGRKEDAPSRLPTRETRPRSQRPRPSLSGPSAPAEQMSRAPARD